MTSTYKTVEYIEFPADRARTQAIINSGVSHEDLLKLYDYPPMELGIDTTTVLPDATYSTRFTEVYKNGAVNIYVTKPGDMKSCGIIQVRPL